ncbi:MAG: glycosyltransferase family 1 protein, partial [bacterium]
DLDARFRQLTEDYPFLKHANVEARCLKWINLPLLLHALFKPLDWPKADLVAGGLDIMFMPSPRLLPVSRRCTKVTTFHDLIFLVFPQYFTFSSRLWQWQMNYPREARVSDRVIAVSYHTKQDLIRLVAASPTNIRMIHEGVGEEYFNSPTPEFVAEVRAKFKLPDQYFYYIGSLDPRKNLVTAVRALAELRDKYSDTIKLVISNSKSWLADDFYQLIEQLGLSDQIIFTGPVKEAEKIALLSQAQAFIFPSIYEGFGLMILEGYAAGCPVVTSNTSSLPEVAGDAAIVLEPYAVSEWATQLHNLLHDRELRFKLIAKGCERARHFTWRKAAEGTLAVFEEAVKSHHGE